MESPRRGGPGAEEEEKKKFKKKNRQNFYQIKEYERGNLLNFQYVDNSEQHVKYRSNKPKTLSHHEKQKLKQNYLQGNFKFFVNPDFDADIAYFDPNQEIQWETVEKVRYITNNKIACPICLNTVEKMIVPKITKCGHIFCWACILRYLSYQKPKCPLCEDFMLGEDLRTAQITHIDVISPGEIVTLKLKKRRKMEFIIYNANDSTEEEEFMRIKKIYFEEILDIKESEKVILYKELTNAEKEKDLDGKAFLERTLILLNEEIQKIKLREHEWRRIQRKSSKESIHQFANYNEDEFYFFYQEANGLNIFLHPINNRAIKNEYEHARNYPILIEGPLVDVEHVQQNERTRKRYKFLNHLPLNSDIIFADVDLKDLLSSNVFQAYKEEMHKHIEEHGPKDDYYNNKSQPIKKSNNPKSIEVSPLHMPIVTNSDPSELKLGDKADYPELPALNSNQNSQNSWLDKDINLYTIGKKPIEKKIDKNPKEETKQPEDYVVREGTGEVTLGDFLINAKVKKPKNKKK